MQNANLVPGTIYSLKGDPTPLVFVTDLRNIISENIAPTALEWPLIFLINNTPTGYRSDGRFTEWTPPPVPVKNVSKDFLKQIKQVKKVEPDSDYIPVLQEIVDLINGLLEDDT